MRTYCEQEWRLFMARFWKLVPLLLMFASFARAQAPAAAQPCEFNKLLPELGMLVVEKGNELNTKLRVELQPHLVPVWHLHDDALPTCELQSVVLPTYGYPNPKDPSKWIWGFPGPTLVLQKPRKEGDLGQKLTVELQNGLPPEADPHKCNPTCTCSATPQSTDPQCCRSLDTFPDCFHGLNTTNLHFHGLHASPQKPQDWILLELMPEKSAPMAAMERDGETVVGTFTYAVNPLRWTTPEGTHWYHPHKHGSVATQVGAGMAGALLIKGEFDDQLNALYAPGGLNEKLMVVQQVQPLNFARENPGKDFLGPVQPLVNGALIPTIEMLPGEIQRWRLIGATIQGSAMLEVDFTPGTGASLTVRQIAMDGIQFHPINYGSQPLLEGGLSKFRLMPGNRADFLVAAPVTPGVYEVHYDVIAALDTAEPGSQRVRKFIEAIAPGDAKPALFRVVVAGTPRKMEFPTEAQFPRMPKYLRDIETSEIKATRNLQFVLNPVKVAFPAGHFFINLKPGENRQFNPACVDITATLGTAEQWSISNNQNTPQPLHVFHIHTNPFQVIEAQGKKLKPPYIWQDAIALQQKGADVVIRQRYEEFTGHFVLHCHFLGHEDRGMMLGVQVVCPDRAKDEYGRPTLTGSECVVGNYIDGARRCIGGEPGPPPPP
jgi:FtsP/CotA-like multicopper oxidase with cupredoxin domain